MSKNTSRKKSSTVDKTDQFEIKVKCNSNSNSSFKNRIFRVLGCKLTKKRVGYIILFLIILIASIIIVITRSFEDPKIPKSPIKKNSTALEQKINIESLYQKIFDKTHSSLFQALIKSRADEILNVDKNANIFETFLQHDNYQEHIKNWLELKGNFSDEKDLIDEGERINKNFNVLEELRELKIEDLAKNIFLNILEKGKKLTRINVPGDNNNCGYHSILYSIFEHSKKDSNFFEEIIQKEKFLKYFSCSKNNYAKEWIELVENAWKNSKNCKSYFQVIKKNREIFIQHIRLLIVLSVNVYHSENITEFKDSLNECIISDEFYNPVFFSGYDCARLDCSNLKFFSYLFKINIIVLNVSKDYPQVYRYPNTDGNNYYMKGVKYEEAPFIFLRLKDNHFNLIIDEDEELKLTPFQA